MFKQRDKDHQIHRETDSEVDSLCEVERKDSYLRILRSNWELKPINDELLRSCLKSCLNCFVDYSSEMDSQVL